MSLLDYELRSNPTYKRLKNVKANSWLSRFARDDGPLQTAAAVNISKGNFDL
jgi:hypothetical protein